MEYSVRRADLLRKCEVDLRVVDELRLANPGFSYRELLILVDQQNERAHNKSLRFGHELSQDGGGTETAEGTARHCLFLALAEHSGSQAIWSGQGHRI